MLPDSKRETQRGVGSGEEDGVDGGSGALVVVMVSVVVMAGCVTLAASGCLQCLVAPMLALRHTTLTPER